MYSVYEAAHAISICGCFGTLRVPPAATAIFDFSAVIALWSTRPRRNEHRERQPLRNGFLGATATAAVICGVLFAYRIASGRPAADSGFVVLDPAALVNRKFPLVDEIDGSGKLKSGRWLLLFYHYDCEECLEAIPTYRTWAASMHGHSDKLRLAFIAIPPFAPNGQDPVSSSPDFLHLRLPLDREWLATTPLAVALQDGQVLAVTAGDQAITPPDKIVWRH